MQHLRINPLFSSLFLLLFTNTSYCQTADMLEVPGELKPANAFFTQLPKGADLHVHLTGASYAENLLNYDKADLLCIKKDFELYQHPPDIPCAAGSQNLQTAASNSSYRQKIIDAWSMRNIDPNQNIKLSHDHFFDIFGKTAAFVQKYPEKLLAEIIEREAKQHVLYMEVIVTFEDILHQKLAVDLAKLDMHKDLNTNLRYLKTSQSLNQQIEESVSWLKRIIPNAKKTLDCDKNPNQSACKFEVRFLISPHRTIPKDQIFTELYAAFRLASEHPDLIAGINFVGPEDHPVSMKDNKEQMQFFNFFHKHFPHVNISLHAGELTKALVSISAKDNHIFEAIHTGSASRIGHGVDLLSETDPTGLLKTMAENKILVEVNLTSNEKLLNIKNNHHPFLFYLNHHVPVALSTDDDGLVRTTLSHEYQLAMNRYHLDYPTLKKIDRNSLTYSFLPGESLWANYEEATPVKACEKETLGGANPSKACQDFLKNSQKAQFQWKLETLFNEFEKTNSFFK